MTCESWGDEWNKDAGTTTKYDEWNKDAGTTTKYDDLSVATFDDSHRIWNSGNVVGDVDRKKSQGTSFSKPLKQMDLIDFNDLEVKAQKNKNEKSGWAIDDEAWMSLESN